MDKKQKQILAVITILAFAILGLWGIDTGQTYYMVSEIKENLDGFEGNDINTMGAIKQGTLDVKPGNITFMLQDIEQSEKYIEVEYTGDLPPNLEEGKELSIEGKIDRQGNLKAEKIVMGCPSKYSE
jgi:cytochrome c-type biogenesis protein CcmE